MSFLIRGDRENMSTLDLIDKFAQYSQKPNHFVLRIGSYHQN